MNTSINEAAALVRKAAKGAGYSWSMAGEAASACVWLCRNGLDGTDMLARHLLNANQLGVSSIQLREFTQPWANSETGLCALSVGTWLCDSVNLPNSLMQDTSAQLHQILTPQLVLSSLGAAGQQKLMTQTEFSNAELEEYEQCLTINVACDSFSASVVCTNDQSSLVNYHANNTDANTDKQTVHIVVDHEQCTGTEMPAIFHRTNLSDETQVILNQFAAKTYAPATESSRQGAGAGDTDND